MAERWTALAWNKKETRKMKDKSFGNVHDKNRNGYVNWTSGNNANNKG